MSFKFCDSHISDYHALGYTVFRDILPPSLIEDLRRASDLAREIAREKKGPQVQRLQPIADYDVDRKPFQDFTDLPELRDAVSRVLTPRHQYGKLDLLGILLEPREMPYSTEWHRDWRDNHPGLVRSEWDTAFANINIFNQLNCPLYEDSSTWVVPGSHLRPDLPGEVERFPDRPILAPNLEGKTSEERERICLDYCHSMPGAVRIYLDAGDFALYRNTLWHLGNYVPYRKRATLHNIVDTPEYVTWRERFTNWDK